MDWNLEPASSVLVLRIQGSGLLHEDADAAAIGALAFRSHVGLVFRGFSGTSGFGREQGLGQREKISLPKTGWRMCEQPAAKRGAKPGRFGHTFRVGTPRRTRDASLVRQPFGVGGHVGIRQVALGKATAKPGGLLYQALGQFLSIVHPSPLDFMLPVPEVASKIGEGERRIRDIPQGAGALKRFRNIHDQTSWIKSCKVALCAAGITSSG